MLSRLSTAFFYILVAFTVFAAATTTITVTPPAATATTAASQCNTGPIYCCNSIALASTPAVGTILGLLGITLTSLNVLVGLTCSIIVGTGCSTSPVCCTNTSFAGIIVIGCSPVNLNLRVSG